MAHKGKMIGSILHDSEGPVDAVVKAESDTAPRDQDSVELETAPCPILLVGQRNAVYMIRKKNAGQEWRTQARPTKVNHHK